MFSPFNLWRIVSSTRAGLRSRELTDPYAVPYTGNAPTVCLLVLHRLFFLIDCGSRLGPVHIVVPNAAAIVPRLGRTRGCVYET